MKEVYIILLCICLGMFYIDLYINIIRPFLIKKTTKELEKNPKWLMSKLISQYYGLNDIDIILVENQKFNIMPRLEFNKREHRFKFLIPNDMATTEDVDIIAKLLLISKLSVKIGPQIGILYSNKPTYWLSILNYMLDGGNINPSNINWEQKE